MVTIDFSRWDEHLGSAAWRMISMYSQFERAAWVTAGQASFISGSTKKREARNTYRWMRWLRRPSRGTRFSCGPLEHQHTIPKMV